METVSTCAYGLLFNFYLLNTLLNGENALCCFLHLHQSSKDTSVS